MALPIDLSIPSHLFSMFSKQILVYDFPWLFGQTLWDWFEVNNLMLCIIN